MKNPHTKLTPSLSQGSQQKTSSVCPLGFSLVSSSVSASAEHVLESQRLVVVSEEKSDTHTPNVFPRRSG